MAFQFKAVKKLREGSPNLIDHLKNEAVDLIINTPNGKGARTDEGQIRAAAVQHGRALCDDHSSGRSNVGVAVGAAKWNDGCRITTGPVRQAFLERPLYRDALRRQFLANEAER